MELAQAMRQRLCNHPDAEWLRLDEVTFEEKDLGQHDEPEEFHNESFDYWCGM